MFLGAEGQRFNVHDALSAFDKVVQQHSLDGDSPLSQMAAIAM